MSWLSNVINAHLKCLDEQHTNVCSWRSKKDAITHQKLSSCQELTYTILVETVGQLYKGMFQRLLVYFNALVVIC